MKILFIYLIVFSVAGRIKTIMDTSGGIVDTEKTTVNTKAISLGSCPCDLTNSCDVYCCCDSDCDEEITDFWKINYAEYCAKSYIYEKYRPDQQCIDDVLLYSMNLRMGMSNTTTNNKTCVNMDVGGAFQTYVTAKNKTDVHAMAAELEPNLTYPLLKQKSYNTERQSELFDDIKYNDVYKKGDQMMIDVGGNDNPLIWTVP